MPRPAIEVHDLVKEFQRRGRPALRAVNGLSFSVAAGSIFGLLGPNGAGKSTTLKILTTLLRPTSGRALVAGYDVAGASLDVRRRIAVVIQEQAADLLLTARDNLIVFARFHGLSSAAIRGRADRVLDDFGLTGQAGPEGSGSQRWLQAPRAGRQNLHGRDAGRVPRRVLHRDGPDSQTVGHVGPS
jgi:ABC-2 type transport system ATP-binding protein